MQGTHNANGFFGKIPDDVRNHVVAVALRHPERGPLRLMRLLKKESINLSASTVYNILRENALQTRELRLIERMKRETENQASVEIDRPAGGADLTRAATVVSYTGPAPSRKGRRIPIRFPLRRAPVGLWVFRLANLAIACLIFYIGFVTAQMIHRMLLTDGSQAETMASGVLPESDLRPVITERTLEDYRSVWTRDLFETIADIPDSNGEISLASLAKAPEDFGLKLIGTVMAEDPDMRVAILDDRKAAGSQGLYHEGDRAGEVRIRKILRNGIVITTGSGDVLLAMESGGTDMKTGGSAFRAAVMQAAFGRQPATGIDNYKLKRKRVAARLANFDRVMRETRMYPYTGNGSAGGVLIHGIHFNNPLADLGLRNGDIIQGLNGERITNTDQIPEFLQRLKEGGDFAIEIVRRNAPREVRLTIM